MRAFVLIPHESIKNTVSTKIILTIISLISSEMLCTKSSFKDQIERIQDN